MSKSSNTTIQMSHNRRSFLKTVGAVSAGVGLISPQVFSKDNEIVAEIENVPQSFKLTILQTTDVHCQVHAHDELFWNFSLIATHKKSLANTRLS